ncbi:hypothetical protein A0H81_04636 [Grifola frondosa]|uniref:Uncharacterized protein n=1 Tax=Grifola frondosa TaxID=5627 RepID=A0A1C7MFN5_GRIFR|nr:hypothetical protein A0H81_04636 [Grifola frondosa]
MGSLIFVGPGRQPLLPIGPLVLHSLDEAYRIIFIFLRRGRVVVVMLQRVQQTIDDVHRAVARDHVGQRNGVPVHEHNRPVDRVMVPRDGKPVLELRDVHVQRVVREQRRRSDVERVHGRRRVRVREVWMPLARGGG